MHRKFMVTLMISILFLTGCGTDLSQEDLVGNGQAFEMEGVEDDLQASNFPDITRQGNEEEYQTSHEEFATLTQLKEEVKGLLMDKYWPDATISEREMAEQIGITKDMYVEYLAEKQVLDAHIDTLIIVHAKEEYIGAVEQALEKYRTKIIAENENHPQNLGKAMASRMETIEDYICFVQLGGDTTIVADQGQEAIVQYCLEENERAIYVLEQAILQ